MDTKNQVLIDIKITGELQAKIQLLDKLKTELSELNKLQKELKTTEDKTDYNKNLVQVENYKNEIKKLSAEVNNEIKLTKSEQGSYIALEQQMVKSKFAYKAMSDQVKNSAVGIALKQQLDQETLAFQKSAISMKEHQFNVGNYASALSMLPGPMGNVVMAAQSMGKAFLTLLMNPIVAFLALLTGALIAVGKSFGKTQEGITVFKVSVAETHSVLGVISERLGKVGSGLLDIIKGNFHEGVDKIKNSFSGAGEQMRQAAEAAKTYTLAMRDLNIEQNTFIIEQSKNKLKVSQLLFTAADATKPFEERKAAIKEAFQLEEDDIAKQKKMAIEEYDIKVANLEKTKNISSKIITTLVTAEDDKFKKLVTTTKGGQAALNVIGIDGFKELQELYAKRYDLAEEFFSHNKRSMGKLSSFENAEAEARKKDRDAEIKELEEYYKRQEKEQKDYIALKDGLAKQLKQQEDKAYAATIEGLELEKEAEELNAKNSIKNQEDLKKELLNIDIKYAVKELGIVKAHILADNTLTDKEKENAIKKAILAIDNLQQQLNEAGNKKGAYWLEQVLGLDDAGLQKLKDDIEITKGLLQGLQNYKDVLISNEQKALDAAYATDKDRIENSKKNTAEKAKEIAKLDKAYRQHKYELDLKEFNTNRAFALTMAIINTALSITNAMTTGDPYSATFRGIAVGLEGGLSIAAILAEKPPEPPGYKKGKIIPGQGNSDTHNANLTPGEAIITNRAVKMFPRQLNAMNIAGGGDPLFGGYASNASAAGVMSDYQMVNAIETAIQNQPPPYISWEEMKKFDSKMVRIRERAIS